MIDGLKPYPAYKNSGVPWLGDVPEHWDYAQLCRYLRGLKDGTHGTFERVADGPLLLSAKNISEAGIRVGRNESRISIRDFQSITANGYPRTGDVLLTIVGSIGRCWAYTASGPMAFQRSVAFLRFTGAMDARFFSYYVQSPPLQDQLVLLTKTSAQGGVYLGALASIAVACPPLPEQTAIVRFLDHADRRIRRYIRAKQKLITLLEEEKQASIHRVVTRGLDPTVRLKPSGVEWLGDVPEHWEVRRLKFLAQIKTGGRDTVDRKDDGAYPFFVRSQTVERIDSYSFDGEAVLTAGDGAGVAKVFHHVTGKFDYHQRVYKFSNFRHVRGRLFFHYFSCTLRFEAFRETAKSTVDSLRLPMLQNFPVPLPPPAEQYEIVGTIEKETQELNRSLDLVRREISLLREFRTRLIADVVTGKLDVREAAARLPDEAEELEPLDEADALTDGEEEGVDDLDAVPEEAEA